MKNHLILLIAAVFVFLISLSPALAKGTVPSNEYIETEGSAVPNVLNVGTQLECGDYLIQIMGQPVVTKSSNSVIADLDMKHLIVRIGITNNSEETVGWLTPDSFLAREIYMNHAYGKYVLDPIMSAKAASGFNSPVFYSSIEPGKMIQTAIVFDVFPEAQGWVITFSPQTFGSSNAEDSVSFQLPKALIQ